MSFAYVHVTLPALIVCPKCVGVVWGGDSIRQLQSRRLVLSHAQEDHPTSCRGWISYSHEVEDGVTCFVCDP